MTLVLRQKIRQLLYHIKHRYATTNNVVLLIAVIIAATWALGSVEVMQRNFKLEQKINTKLREEELAKLQVQKLKFESRYFKSIEYQDLAAREKLGLVGVGEKVLILPDNSAEAKKYDETYSNKNEGNTPKKQSNIDQWMDFLLGIHAKRLQNIE